MMKNKPKIAVIIGARPQFIKHFPFENAAKDVLDLVTIHTGQHYDANMSAVFFEQLKMQKPHYMLSIGGGNHGNQTGRMMVEIEQIVEKEQPSGMVVYGDTNSTLAGALVAAKLHIPLFHIEAGLRSYNKEMPEEVNRVLTDHISSLLFVPSKLAVNSLKKEGITKGVQLVGDIMKDLVTYVKDQNLIGARKSSKPYYYVTIHRPYNTDAEDRLKYILNQLNTLDKNVIMSLHPRTKNLIQRYAIDLSQFPNIQMIDPQSYFDNLNYLFFSDGLITDSGGMQKEAYWLEKKCVTIRKETEWVETIKLKGNTLLFDDISEMAKDIKKQPTSWHKNLYGEGNCAQQIVNSILKY